MNKVIGVIVALLVVGGGLYVFNQSSNKVPTVYSERPAQNTGTEVAVELAAPTIENTGVVETEVIQTAGYFLPYSPEDVSRPMTDTVVLAFLADWCPTCRAVKGDIQARLGEIPANLTILDINYDEYADLKKKYGVTQQHTFVQVDTDGNPIKTWKGGNTLDSVIAQVN